MKGKRTKWYFLMVIGGRLFRFLAPTPPPPGKFFFQVAPEL